MNGLSFGAIALALAVAAFSMAGTAGGAGNQIEWQSCHFSDDQMVEIAATLECGTIEVFEN